MNKRKRVEYNGAIYHVIQRGNNKEFIFDRDQDKWTFLDSLEQVTQFYEAETLAYAIMGNHYHLVMRTGETGLGRMMHRLNTGYSIYYNHVKERSGHVFQGRYQAILITDELHFQTVVRYVHRNPVRAGICQQVEDYHWSSDAIYRGWRQSSFVNKNLLLDLLAANNNNASFEYARLMDNAEPEEESGNLQLTPQIQAATLLTHQSPAKPANSVLPLDDILLTTVGDVEAFRLIKSGSRRRELTGLKSAYIDKAIKYGHPLQEIADNINISKSALCQLKQKTSGR